MFGVIVSLCLDPQEKRGWPVGNSGHENDLGEQQPESPVRALAAEVEMQGPFQLWRPQCP